MDFSAEVKYFKLSRMFYELEPQKHTWIFGLLGAATLMLNLEPDYQAAAFVANAAVALASSFSNVSKPNDPFYYLGFMWFVFMLFGPHAISKVQDFLRRHQVESKALALPI